MRSRLIALLPVFLAAPALATTPDEWGFLMRSIRPDQAVDVEAGTGGLARLPMLELEVHLALESHEVTGHAILDWRNNTGLAQSSLPIRFSSNGGESKVGWNHVTVTMPGGQPLPAKVRQQSATISIITLPGALAPDAHVIVHGDLQATLGTIMPGSTDPVMASMAALSGGGKPPTADGQQYGTFACGDDICTLTGFAPEVPAFFDGHFDTSEGSGIGDPTYSEPENVIFSVVADRGVVLAVTGFEIGHIQEGQKDRWTYAMAATREVGVIASPEFEIDEARVDGVVVRSYSRRSDREAGKSALESARSALHILSEAFGKYPWTFLNVCESALVGGAGGVELPGLALGASGFYAPGGGTLGTLGIGGNLAGDILDFITRHEVAHQWWALQVGSHSQIHPYIDEPLAQWSALYTVRQAEGPETAQRIKQMQIAANYQALAMMGISDGVVARPAGRFKSMIEYAGLVYGKAPLFYEAAAQLIGERQLLAALRDLVNQRRFGRATPQDLRGALIRGSASHGAQMKALWKRWFEETHGQEDVGSLDIAGIAGSMGLDLGGMLGGSPEDTAAALKEMEDLMRQMGDTP